MIEANQVLKASSLLSYRKKLNQSEIQQEMNNIDIFIKESGLSVVGPKISSVRAAYGKDNDVLSIEVLIPIDKKFDKTGDYKFKKDFTLNNCLKISYTGSTANFQELTSELEEYLSSNELYPVSNLYTISNKIIDPNSENELFEIFGYVSVATADEIQ